MSRNEFSARRFDGSLRRSSVASSGALPVHVIVS